MGTLWSLGDRPTRVFKWTPSFNPKMEAPLAPRWIRLRACLYIFLIIMLYLLSADYRYAASSGLLTKTSLSRLSMARACIELDLLKERIEEIVLEFDNTTQVQKIIYERIPEYCTHCKHIGHSLVGCYMNGNVTRPPPPVRHPSSRVGSDDHDLKGLSGNIDKFRGVTGISKISRAENHNPTRSANRAVAQNHEWIQDTDNKAWCSPIIYSNNDNLAEKHVSGNGLNSLEKEVTIPSEIIDSPICLDIIAGVIKGDNCSAFSDNIPPDLSKSATLLEDGNLQGPTSMPLPQNKVEDAKHNLDSDINNTYGPNPLSTSPSRAAVSRGVGPGIFCPLNYPTHITTLAPPPNPSLAAPAHLHLEHDNLDQQCYTYGNSMGPTTTFHTSGRPVGDDGQHTLVCDAYNNIGPCFSPSPCDVGPDVLLSPLHYLAHNSQWDPPNHPPSSTHASHSLVEHDNLDHQCSFYGRSHGRGPMPCNDKKVDDSLLPYELDGINSNGPYTSSSLCASPICKLGPPVSLSPLIQSAHHTSLDPLYHPSSSPHITHNPLESRRWANWATHAP
ncbi:hypothetical protein DH2020_037401 [Rehmannia glutinosa]|uniref:DUF4283 domain-containing protein n=1 Tax=Rehmannia glutinosa TaxID=99300 RepID=A0ABR0V301_REHGL